MKSNNILNMIILVMVFTTSACGQQRGGNQRGMQQGPPPIPTDKEIVTMVNDLSKQILMSEEQEKQVLEVYQNHFEQMEDLEKSGRPDRKIVEALKASMESEINEILTADQQKLYSEYLSKKIKSRPQRRQ